MPSDYVIRLTTFILSSQKLDNEVITHQCLNNL